MDELLADPGGNVLGRAHLQFVSKSSLSCGGDGADIIGRRWALGWRQDGYIRYRACPDGCLVRACVMETRPPQKLHRRVRLVLRLGYRRKGYVHRCSGAFGNAANSLA